MGTRKTKPEYMELLEGKGIYARNYFCFSDNPKECFAVTRSFNITDLDGNSVPFTYDDFWEKYEKLVHLTKEQFEGAQEAYWDTLRIKRGEPTNLELEPIVKMFVDEYTRFYEVKRWSFICDRSEETIRRILNRATNIILGGKKTDQKQWQSQFDKMFKDVILERIYTQRKLDNKK